MPSATDLIVRQLHVVVASEGCRLFVVAGLSGTWFAQAIALLPLAVSLRSPVGLVVPVVLVAVAAPAGLVALAT